MRRDFFPFGTPTRGLLGWPDFLFAACVLLLSFFAVRGSIAISAEGAVIDSDLATYAEGMAGALYPEFFVKDPLLHAHSAGNSIVNLERVLATLLMGDENVAVGLLRASGIILIVFYLSWYVFGRFLFHRRDLALLLVCAVSITVWVGLGTFWGVTHSDPVPRVFHGALWPWMLMLTLLAYERASLRPPAMLVAGLGMWLHGVSALNCGAMFFAAFFFHKPHTCSWAQHFFVLLLSLIAFFIPVLFFLWPSLTQGQAFTADDLSVFNALFTLRWREDYGDIPASLLAFVSPTHPEAFLLYAGLIASIIVRFIPDERVQAFGRMVPSFLLALLVVVLFSLLETRYAPALGRVPMGHELVRGVKFLVPLSWIGIVACCAWLLSSLAGSVRSFLVVCAFAVVFFFSQDKQYQAVHYAISESLNCALPLTDRALESREKALLAREALEALKKHTEKGSLVFCLDDAMMAIRYLSLRPLAYSFKDGYAHFYSKDIEGAREWLAYTRLLFADDHGLKTALVRSGAGWYLERRRAAQEIPQGFTEVWHNAAWSLFKRL